LYPVEVRNEPKKFLSDFKTILEKVFDGTVLHFDLKLDNVMKTKNEQLRLIDFDKVGCINLYPNVKFSELETVKCDKKTYVNVGILIFIARYVLDGHHFPLLIIETYDFDTLDTIMSENESNDMLQNFVDDIAGQAQFSLEEGEEEPSYAQHFNILFNKKIKDKV
jgi:serine/threonine protein kinase